jgi:hypothetical protein
MPDKPDNGIKLERDLYAPVKAHLQSLGWDVKAEVEGCDAAALRDGKLLAVELKLSLNLDVILQAVQRQRLADAAYVAVPAKRAAMRTRRWRDTLELLKRLNIGLLTVSHSAGAWHVEELIEPVLCEGNHVRGHAVRRRSRILEEMQGRTGDWNTGGVRGQKLVTAYREAALRLAALLADGGPMSAKQLKPDGERSRSTYLILKNNHYNWFRPLGKGLFALTDVGRQGLDAYREITMGSTGAVQGEEDAFSGTVVD